MSTAAVTARAGTPAGASTAPLEPSGFAAALRAVGLAAAPTVLVLLMGLDGVVRAGPHGAVAGLFLLGQAVPLLLWRVAPRTVLVLVTGVTVVQLWFGAPVTNGFLAQAVAVAAVVVHTRWPASAVVPTAVLLANALAAGAGGLAGAGRYLTLAALSLLLGWVLGDAARRRAVVRTAKEREIAARVHHARLRHDVAALSERLHIARELHDLVGEALDSVVLHAGAARTRPADVEARTAAIESAGRGALAELDRFLALLRRGADAAPGERAPLPAPVLLPENRRPAWLEEHAPHLALAGAAGGVGVVVVLDVSGPAAATGLPGWFPIAYAAVLTVLLVLRGRHPEPVLAAVTVVLCVPFAAGIPVDNAALAVPVAAHAVISLRTRRRGVLLGTLALLAVVLAATGVSTANATEAARVLPAVLAIALFAGDTSRGARELNDRLQQRLEEVEEQGRLRERAAVAEERARVARDLHDSLGHTLSLVVLQAGAARLATTTSPSNPSRAEEALASVERSARSALEDLDAALAVVEPDGAGRSRAGEALAPLVDSMRAAGTTVTLSEVPLDDLPRSYRTTVFRVVQEALTNVVKHAPGATATVEVVRADGVVSVAVTSSPPVGPPLGLPTGGRGLTGMRERVAMVGGRLEAGATADGGYVVTAHIPVPGGGDEPPPLHPIAPILGKAS